MGGALAYLPLKSGGLNTIAAAIFSLIQSMIQTTDYGFK
jgi:hypothetical protein